MMSCFNLHSLIINGFERLVSIQVFPFVDCLFCPLSIFLLGFLFFLFPHSVVVVDFISTMNFN